MEKEKEAVEEEKAVEELTTSANPFGDDGALSQDAIALVKSTSRSRLLGVRADVTLKNTPKKKLLQFLKESKHFDVAQLLSRVHGTTLYEESVFLYSKSGRHGEALRVLAWVLKNEKWAHEYCTTQTVENTQYPEPASVLLLMLLNVYLLSDDASGKDPNKPEKPMEAEARRLLEQQGKFMNPAKVLAALPDNTSLSYISSFLLKVIPHQQSVRREVMIKKNLSKAELHNEKVRLIDEQGKQCFVGEDKLCGVCV